MKWIKFDGYDESHLYVDDSEKVLGEVSGSRFQKQEGWFARTEEDGRLGRYMTLEAAKAAVESHFNKETEPDKPQVEGKVVVVADEDYAALKKDAERYQFFKRSARVENRDGGWWGFFSLPKISAYDITRYAEENGLWHDFRKSFDEAVDAEINRRHIKMESSKQ